jgi:hypothetical protein
MRVRKNTVMVLAIAGAAVGAFALSRSALAQTHIERGTPWCTDCHAHGLSASYTPFGADVETRCKSCHNPTGVASDMSDVANHVIVRNGVTNVIDCGMCHEVHGDAAALVSSNEHTSVTATNLSLVRGNIDKYVPQALAPAVFHTRPGNFAFAEADPPWNGICQACHTNTAHHTRDAFGDHDHEIGSACTDCHLHKDGFMPSYGDCLGCHNAIRGSRRAVVGEFSLTSHHVSGTVSNEDCRVCHYEAVSASHHKNGAVDLRDPDDGTDATLISVADFSRNLSTDVLEAWVTNVQDRFCLKCHDADGAAAADVPAPGHTAKRPFTSNTRDAADVFTQFATTNRFHHAVRGAGTNAYCVPSGANGNSITMVAPWNQSATHDRISCFDCHAANGHGADNQRMLLSAIDFDKIAAATSHADLSLADGIAVESFCTRCHKSGVYLTSGSPRDVGSRFGAHGDGRNQHTAGLSGARNRLGCMGCHAGTADLSGLASSNGAQPGRIHGGSFTWPAGSRAAGTNTQYFVAGGYVRGWRLVENAVKGACSAGTTSCHSGEKDYER